jgi:hypothetical protein
VISNSLRILSRVRDCWVGASATPRYRSVSSREYGAFAWSVGRCRSSRKHSLRTFLCPPRKPVPSPARRLSRFDSRYTARLPHHVGRRQSSRSGCRSRRHPHHRVQLPRASEHEPGSPPTSVRFLGRIQPLSHISLLRLCPGCTLQPRHAWEGRGQSSFRQWE